MPIRPAKSEDAVAIAGMWNPIIRESSITFTTTEKTVGELQSLITSKNTQNQGFYIAEATGEVIGFATYGKFRNGPGYAHIAEHSVMLAKYANGKGIGRELMLALEDHARKCGIKSFIAGIGGENTGGILFHKAIGFHEVGHIKQAGFKFDRWHDLVLMQKFL